MSDIDNPTRVKRKEHLSNLEEKRRLADIGFVMNTPEGRRVMNDLLKRCGVARLSMAGRDEWDGIRTALQTAFYEGQRNIGNYYWGVLTKNFKKEWLVMTDEAEKKLEAQNGRDSDSTGDGNRPGTDEN